jgi:predicted nuclease of predicted toxin-antitoxin system
MRILLDECLPRRLRQYLTGHYCRTVQEMGWSGKKNGELLSLAEAAFDVLLTIDKGISFQQSLAGRQIGVVVFAARSNRLERLIDAVPAVQQALRSVRPGTLVVAGRK